VCESCGVGLVQHAAADVAPAAGDAFLIVDSSLRVQAVSEAAERLLAVSEQQAASRHVTGLLLPADAEAADPSALAEAITQAAGAEDARATVFVRPGMTFGLRLRAQIAACGPPSRGADRIQVALAVRARRSSATGRIGSCCEGEASNATRQRASPKAETHGDVVGVTIALPQEAENDFHDQTNRRGTHVDARGGRDRFSGKAGPRAATRIRLRGGQASRCCPACQSAVG
jgi:PAS domain-containing protein